MLPIVLIDPDPDGREWLIQSLLATGRPLRGFADFGEAQAALRPDEVSAVLVAIGRGSFQAPSRNPSQDPSGGSTPGDSSEGDGAHSVREVACWIRASAGRPALLAFARRALAPSALVSALHRGATAVITVDQMVIVRELVEAQLRAREAWGQVSVAAKHRASADPSTETALGEEESGGEANGVPASMREVTLTPRTAIRNLPVQEPGWIPRPVDFQITDSDPIDLKLYESKAVLRAIADAGGNRTLAAQLLGIGKSTLYRRLSEWRATLS